MLKKKKNKAWMAFDHKDPKLPTDPNRRVCMCLLWGAETLPRRPCGVRFLVKVWLGQDALPREDNPQIVIFMNRAIKRIRIISPKEFKHHLIFEPGLGYRYSVDDNDVMENVVEKKAKRSVVQMDKLEELLSDVDPKKLSPENLEKYNDYKKASAKFRPIKGYLPSSTTKKKIAPEVEDTTKKGTKKKR
jgi:hypothetical protein